MFDINNLFNSTGGSIIGVAVTPNVGLEVAEIDKKTSRIIKYGHKSLAYNMNAREIENYDEFKAGLVDLYNKLQIDSKSDVYIVLPNVHFGFLSFPPIMIDEAIDSALLSKAEESYIFRRVEPKTAWVDVNFKNRTDSRYLAYSSFQINAVDRLVEKVEDIGGKVVGIETSYSALLRAIHYSGIYSDVIEQNKNWNVLLINPNSYAVFSLVGENLVDYTEVPLALKSFSHEEAYQAIATSVSQILVNYPAPELLVISQFDDISAQVIQTQMSVDANVRVLDCNKFSEGCIVETSDDITDKDNKKISLSVIGAASANISTFPTKLNVLGSGKTKSGFVAQEVTIFGKTILITEALVAKVLLFTVIILALIYGVLIGCFTAVENMYKKQEDSAKEKITQIQAEIQKLQGDDPVNIEDIIAQIVDNNVKAITFYDSISMDIPKNIWLTSYQNSQGQNMSVSGMSLHINDIYKYFKNLKILSPNSTIRLNQLKLVTDMYSDDYNSDSVDSEVKFYTFEIGNLAGAPMPSEPSSDEQNGKSKSVSKSNSSKLSPDSLEAPPELEPLD